MPTDWINQKVFDAIYGRSLVYNTCWEDPAVDRLALNLRADDTLVVITSAGCNVLDYALEGPGCIHAIDANPRQTALLELKLAGIRRLDFPDFFALFGRGLHDRFRHLYLAALRPDLSPFARAFWDRRADWFTHGFYYRGLAGTVARSFRTYLKARPRLASGVDALFEARSIEEQRAIYDDRVAPLLWDRWVNWALSRQFTMSMLGVPCAQRREVQSEHGRGVSGYVREAIEYVSRELPLWTNYFWRVYFNGHYTEDCCPEYLRHENFDALKRGLVDRIVPHTCTVTQFLQTTDERISKFVLLDHMDWMSASRLERLEEEWAAILSRARSGARILFRSAHSAPSYLERIRIGEGARGLRDVLVFHRDLAAKLQRLDRVHTYAGFHIADVTA
jgi:S-adenosylmethionine-diacylglycerol 3-amino-3-carboxypropyl transferase